VFFKGGGRLKLAGGDKAARRGELARGNGPNGPNGADGADGANGADGGAGE